MIELTTHTTQETARELAKERAHRLARLIRKEHNNYRRYKLIWLMRNAARKAQIEPPLTPSDIALIGRKKKHGKALDYEP